MRRLPGCCTVAFVLVPVLSCRAWYPYPEVYNSWQQERPFLMSALHNSVPRDHLPERMARFKAAGLNDLCWGKPGNALHIFRAAQEAGLAWSCWSRGGMKAVGRAMEIPGSSFIMAGDEPSSEEEVARIAELTTQLRQAYPGTPVFVNLSITKVDHDSYIEACKPDVFSFDHYPLQRNGETHDHYLYNLAWGRQTAMEHRLPYWMYLQTFGREHERPSYAYRVPDEADMRFLVYTLLAHGGTGIMLFNYYGYPESMVVDTGVENPARSEQPHIYENTVVSRAWHAVRDVAPEVQNLGRALMLLRPKGRVAYAGNGLLWDRKPPTYDRHNPKPPFRSQPFAEHGPLRSVRVLGEDEMGALVSFFDDEAAEEYFMVVNLRHGLNMSKADGTHAVRLTFGPEIEQVERLNRWTGRVEVLRTSATEDGGGTRQLTLTLEGGTGDLLKWSNGKPWSLR